MENGWFRAGTNWEEVDMDRSTVLDYANLRPRTSSTGRSGPGASGRSVQGQH